MVKRIRSIEEMLDPTRPIAQPTTFVGGPMCGKFIYIMAKVQAGLPLSALDRDIILEVLRRQWLTKKEHSAFLRQAKRRHIETSRDLAKHGVRYGDRERWVQTIHEFDTLAIRVPLLTHYPSRPSLTLAPTSAQRSPGKCANVHRSPFWYEDEIPGYQSDGTEPGVRKRIRRKGLAEKFKVHVCTIDSWWKVRKVLPPPHYLETHT
jgi:hypothetical protein